MPLSNAYSSNTPSLTPKRLILFYTFGARLRDQAGMTGNLDGLGLEVGSGEGGNRAAPPPNLDDQSAQSAVQGVRVRCACAAELVHNSSGALLYEVGLSQRGVQ